MTFARAWAQILEVLVGKGSGHRFGYLVKISEVFRLSVTLRSRVGAMGGGIDYWGCSSASFSPIPNRAKCIHDVPVNPPPPEPWLLFLSPTCHLPGSSLCWSHRPDALPKDMGTGKCTPSPPARLGSCIPLVLSLSGTLSPLPAVFFHLQTRKPRALFASVPNLSPLSVIKLTNLGKLPPCDDTQRCLIRKHGFLRVAFPKLWPFACPFAHFCYLCVHL